MPFSLEQMDRQYRAGGVTVALGLPSIAYTEGRCAGGGTEINSGLYRRPPEEVLERWRRDREPGRPRLRRAVPDLRRGRAGALACRPCPGQQTAASEVLRRGAAAPRLAPRRDPALDGLPERVRRAIRSAAEHDANLPPAGRRPPGPDSSPGTASTGWCSTRGRAFRAEATTTDGRAATVDFAPRRSSAGAPSRRPPLLQRSGLRRHIGRVARRAPDGQAGRPVRRAGQRGRRRGRPPGEGVRPRPLVRGVGLQPGPGRALALSDQWDRFGAGDPGLASTCPSTTRRSPARAVGGCCALPGLRDPLVTYRLTRRDRELLGRGLARLALLMLEAGADEVYPSYPRRAGRAHPARPRRPCRPPSRRRQRQRDDRAPVLDRADGRGPSGAAPTASAGCTAPQTSGSTTRRCCRTRRGSTRRRRSWRWPSATPGGSSRRSSRDGGPRRTRRRPGHRDRARVAVTRAGSTGADRLADGSRRWLQPCPRRPPVRDGGPTPGRARSVPSSRRRGPAGVRRRSAESSPCSATSPSPTGSTRLFAGLAGSRST